MSDRPTFFGQEKVFDMMEIREAATWGAAGGIAIHRNFDVDGMTIGGKVRSGRAYHVFGREKELLEWGKRNGQSAAWLQPEKRAKDGALQFPPHFDVFGGPARAMERRLHMTKSAK